MKQFKADSAVTIHPGSKVGLTTQQFTPRAHNLQRIGDANGIITCNVIKPIQFKIGEVFFAEDLPKSMASLLKQGAGSGESGAQDDGAQGDLSFADMNVKQLKAFLEENGVEIPKGAKKPELVALAEGIKAPADKGQDEDDQEGDDDQDDENEDAQ